MAAGMMTAFGYHRVTLFEPQAQSPTLAADQTQPAMTPRYVKAPPVLTEVVAEGQLAPGQADQRTDHAARP